MMKSRARLWSDAIIVDLAFVINFTAFQSMQNLQSSLNYTQGLGTIGLSVVYGALVVSALFLPPFCIRRFGCKWTIAMCLFPYAIFMAANLHATWWTIIPSAILLGFAAAPLWGAKCTFLTQIAVCLATKSAERSDVVISRLFGLFFMAFQTCTFQDLIHTFISFTSYSYTYEA